MKNIFFLFSMISFVFLHGQIDTATYEVDTNLYKTNIISGTIKTIEWKSKSMKELRKISLYEPVDFHKDSSYSLVVVSDNQAKALANALETKMTSKQIESLIIVGIHNREPQAIDSIFGGHQVDFRTVEMLGIQYISSENIDFKNPKVIELISNRAPKFQNLIVNEITNYMINHYELTDRENWTFGGFSNGGFLAMRIGTLFPKSFGHIIAMSPAGDKNGSYSFNYSSTKSRFYICAGTKEHSFHKNSLTIAKALKQNNIKFEHQSFNAGHDYNMWLNFYVDCLSRIYKR